MDAVTLDRTTTGPTAALSGRALHMKALEDENARLRRLLVDALLAGPRPVAESEAEHWGQCGPQPDVGDALLLCNV